MTNVQVGQGWDYEPPVSAGRAEMVKLAKKGDKATVRIVAAPVHYQKFSERYQNTRTIFLWLVLERTADGSVVRVMQTPSGPYLDIRRYKDDPDWGDISTYDVTIERTEVQGQYYTVTPKPNKSKITEAEMAMIAEAGVDLVKLATAFSSDKKAKASESLPVGQGQSPAPAGDTDDGDLPF